MTADQATIQNLIDAGCCTETVRQFAALSEKGDTRAQLRLLYAYREKLLDIVHEDQSRLSRLDYLIFQIRNG